MGKMLVGSFCARNLTLGSQNKVLLFFISIDFNLGCARDSTNRALGGYRDSCDWSQAFTKRKEHGQSRDVRRGTNRTNC